MRTPQDIPSNIDMSRPYTPQDMGDCFGVEYSPKAKECEICHAHPMCLNALELANKAKKPEPILAKADFSLVKWEEIYGKVGEITTDELINLVQTQSRCNDEETLLIHIRRFFVNYKVKSKEGRIVHA